MISIINNTITERLAEFEVEKEHSRTIVTKHIVEIFDFSSLKDAMSKGGISLTTYKCPSCGAGLKVPDSGETISCEHCGAQIRATDVYQKIKGLI